MISYKQAGVDIDAGANFISRMGSQVEKTHTAAVLGGLGGFGACFSLKEAGVLSMKDPVLVSSTDGVGTKLKLAVKAEQHYHIGIDLVAMAVNDISALGARPLFLLDYIATGKLESNVLSEILKGIIEGCKRAECALVGGETAEMPGVYASGDYDLSACVVGVLERDALPDFSKIKPGDILVGIESSGFHSNGYSLIRKAVPELELAGKLLQDLLCPTKIYHHVATEWASYTKGMAHITGGGLIENVPRILPWNTRAALGWKPWTIPSVIMEVLSGIDISLEEAFRVFNMGIGWVGVFDPKDVDKAVQAARGRGFHAYLVGHIEGHKGEPCAKLAPDLDWALGYTKG